MLKGFGKLHSVTKRHFSLPTGHVTFIADRPQKSLVVVSLAADNLKIITHKWDIITQYDHKFFS